MREHIVAIAILVAGKYYGHESLDRGTKKKP
jgi:hypothetical protein